MITKDQLVAFDVETAGVEEAYALQPFRAGVAELIRHGQRQAWLTSYATAEFDTEGEVITAGEIMPSADQLRGLLQRLSQDKKHVVAWNATFDIAWLLALGLREEVYAINWLDGMNLYRHLVNAPTFVPDAVHRFGLKETAVKWFPEAEGYGDNVDFFDQSPENLKLLHTYNRADSRYTLMLAWTFLDALPHEVLRSALIEARSLPMAAEAVVNGLAVNREAAAELSEKLAQVAVAQQVTLRVTSGELIEPETIRSPAKLGEILYGKWGIKPPAYTASGQPSTDKAALAKVAVHDQRAKHLYLYREAINNRTKFADGAVASVDYNGDQRTRPWPRVFGTYTGRMTYSSKVGRGKGERPSGMPIHQWKKGEDFRNIVEAPPGYTILEYDFSGQEFRWMAVESGDQTMLHLCRPGEDAHAYMGGRVSSLTYEAVRTGAANDDPAMSRARRLGKVANLSLQYRTSWMRLQEVAFMPPYNLELSSNEARAIHATYLTTYRQVPVYWRRQIEQAGRLGYVQTLAGRRVRLGVRGDWNMAYKWSYESTAINFPIQGIGADQKYLALLVLRDYLNQIGGYFYFELHDGIFVIVPDDRARAAAPEIRKLLSNLPYKKAWGVDLPIEFPVDGKHGKTWGALRPIEE